MDRRNYIFNRLKEHYTEAIKFDYEVVGIWLQGSQNYNLDEYSEQYMSDIDTKCIVLPSLKNLINNEPEISFTHVLANDEHIDFKDIRIIFNLFKKQNIQYLEILFSDFYIVNPKYTDLVEQLLSKAEYISNIDYNSLLKTIMGMSLEKYKALEHPYPTIKDKIDKFGYDPKQLHHILRLYDFMMKFINGTSFKDSLISTQPEYLMQVKKGCYSLEKARELAKTYIEAIKNTRLKYSLTEPFVDTKTLNFLDDLKVDFIKRYIYSNKETT